MKKHLINLRVDDSTKDRLKDTSHSLQLNESEFIRKAIWEYESLLEQADKWTQREERITQLEASLKQLKRQLQAYEDDIYLTNLFSAHKGQIIDDKRISQRADLVNILAKNTTINVLETEDRESLTSEIIPIVLQAQPIPIPAEEKSEPFTWKEVTVGVKRYWLLLLTFLGAGIAYMVWRWWSKSKKQADQSDRSRSWWRSTSLTS
ncbi:hypothetical protein [Runella sp.]|uniref:hypothetical protein n=1 Tax=Runella sp. TaxID=1960881 RepID=UPI003D0F907A